MNMVKRFYGILEENISLIMRVFVILTVTVVLLLTLLNTVSGYFMSNKEASLKTGINGAEYADIEELVFPKQERVDEYEGDEEEVEDELVVDPKIEAIRASMRLHFDERSATRGQFDERITIDALNDTIRAIAMGEYQLSQDSRSAYPSDLAECPRRTSFPMITLFYEVLETDEDFEAARELGFSDEEIDELNEGIVEQEKEYQRFLSQMVDFWSDAEPTDEEKSKFESVTRIEERLQTLWAANDLFLCGWIQSKTELEEANAKAEMEAAETRAEGESKIREAREWFVVVMTFLAAFALVLATMTLVRIEKHMSK
jgi:hypothetical protein